MRPFTLLRASSAGDAVRLARTGSQFIAGGTTLVDLMKLGVMHPSTLVDINAIAREGPLGRIEVASDEIRLGALVRMSEAASSEALVKAAPVLTQTLDLAASQQLRNMATLGGNVLQRTRCPYFRDPSWAECNKREPGSGCAALNGVNRMHAVLGTSDACIATYPGDWAQALIALDAEVEIAGERGARRLAFSDLHREPGGTPHIETALDAGDLVMGFRIPRREWMRRSVYVKVRDRESYEFAMASAAVALDLDGDRVREVRIAVGGLATVPWRAREAERLLRGQRLDEDAARRAAEVALDSARAGEHNAFKVPLGKATIVRALLEAQAMEI